ncbi:hypothetical protein EZV62_002488 [Acer yangbiense]|uniref:HMA domain-containing protein n=1 Tax=Acer yangbiense TaxID=1000413 RepID=A0A5C7IXR8_9ROSI|nr:hypothetical protein EZV62_002488 [Acer yangbiense]
MVTEKLPENTPKKEISPYGPWLLDSYGKQGNRSMNGRNGQVGNGNSNGMQRKGSFGNPGGAYMMNNKDGRSAEDKMGKNKGVKTSNAGMGKGSRFDILSEEVEIMVGEDVTPPKSKDTAGKSQKNNNILKEITNHTKKQSEKLSRTSSSSGVKLLRKGDTCPLPNNRLNAASGSKDKVENSEGGSKGKKHGQSILVSKTVIESQASMVETAGTHEMEAQTCNVKHINTIYDIRELLVSSSRVTVTEMLLKVHDLECSKCYKKVKKILCKFPHVYVFGVFVNKTKEIQDQVYDEKNNTVRIKLVCCSPEKIRDKICCKGRGIITSIEIVIKPPEKPKTTEKPKPPEKPKTTEKPKPPEKPKTPEVKIKDKNTIVGNFFDVPKPCYCGRNCDGYCGRPVYCSCGCGGYGGNCGRPVCSCGCGGYGGNCCIAVAAAVDIEATVEGQCIAVAAAVDIEAIVEGQCIAVAAAVDIEATVEGQCIAVAAAVDIEATVEVVAVSTTAVKTIHKVVQSSKASKERMKRWVSDRKRAGGQSSKGNCRKIDGSGAEGDNRWMV